MPATLHFRQLSAPWQKLVRLCQSIDFGRIEDLDVRSGEPVFSPAPRVLCSVDLAADEGSRPEYHLGDFALPKETARLMGRLSELGHGTVTLIEVRAGLPRRLVIENTDLGVRR
jgi:hypothetical protein